MTKALLFLLLTVGLTSAVAAQSFRLGVKAGPSLSNFTGRDLTSDYRLAAHAGLVADCNLNDLLSIQPELLFSMKGDENKSFNSTAHINLSYLDVPILLKVKAGSLFFEAGPQVSLRLSGKYEINNVSLKITDNYRTLDFGYAAGLGYQLASGLNAGLRYNAGFRDPINENPILPGSGFSAKGHNSVFQFYVGYLLPGV